MGLSRRIIGLDPGLQRTGWGIIVAEGNRLSHVANGVIQTVAKAPTPERLTEIDAGITAVIREFNPDEAAVEETFLNRNPGTTLKLGLARGVVLLTPARAGLPVSEYAAKEVKKSLVGYGSADKAQVAAMAARLLPGVEFANEDAADAIAVAICHAHASQTMNRWAQVSNV
ncbi:MAG: crossover junction endodeoxyribonuclease RuvC [Rhodospirillales bacterium]|jgi:crossover junction endodeoxyribonuclease RuvC